MRKVSSPRRYIRVPDSLYIGKMAREVWKVRPKFDIRETEGTTEFVFRLKFNIPKRIKDSHEAAYEFLFTDTRADWKRTFKLAYSRTRHGGKKAKRQFDILLYKVFVQALVILAEKAKASGELYADLIKLEPTLLVVESRRKRRPRKQAYRRKAIRLAKRYKQLKPQVDKLRKFVKNASGSMDENTLRAEAERCFRSEWILHVTQGGALKNLLPIPGYTASVESLGRLNWTVRQLTFGIMVCEEEARAPATPLKAVTIDKYIREGNRHLKTPTVE